MSEVTMEKIVSLAKRRGFVYPGSEIYGGLSGFWDYGPLGIALKRNIENLWWRTFVEDRDDMYGVDAAIIMHREAWKASGHVGGFSDPMVECKKCKRLFRQDQIGDPSTPLDSPRDKGLGASKCPECGGSFGDVRQFNMMFKTHVGATEDESAVSYLRPETAGGIFLNFKNIVDSFHPKLPFGIAQIGKAFRNEIAPRDFLFRVRELEQMEVEYFVKEADWKPAFEMWRKEIFTFMSTIGIDTKNVSELEVGDNDRAHYSKRTIDFEFEFPFGRKELYGLVYRADYDLKNHARASGIDISYLDEETKEKIVPHVIEPSLGVGRSFFAVLLSAYTEDTMGDEPLVYLKFKPSVAPVKVAVFPLLKNKPQLVEKAREVYAMLKKEFGAVVFDDNGNIGKRYRRQDEIGTYRCVTIDFQTLDDNTLTVRGRDSGKQERVGIAELAEYIEKQLLW